MANVIVRSFHKKGEHSYTKLPADYVPSAISRRYCYSVPEEIWEQFSAATAEFSRTHKALLACQTLDKLPE